MSDEVKLIMVIVLLIVFVLLAVIGGAILSDRQDHSECMKALESNNDVSIARLCR